jgi:hypothetical protein
MEDHQNGHRRPWTDRRLADETKTSTEIVNADSLKKSDAKRNVDAPLDQVQPFERQPDLFGPQPPALLVNADTVGRSCRCCGNETFIATPPKGPHSMGLVCVSCGAHGGWVPRDVADELRRRAAS